MKKPESTATNPVRSSAPAPAYRSGTAARLAGLSVETLRVWERRYQLSDADRSEHGQRLYSAEQINRLRLLKTLVDQGHAIGSIADMQLAQLEELLRSHVSEQTHRADPIRVALVGSRLKERLAIAGRDHLALDIRCNSPTLHDAMTELPDAGAEVLVVEIAELDESAVPLIEKARQAANVRGVVVMYRFCASAIIRQLRLKHCFVARVPADMGELVGWCRTVLAGQRAAPPAEQTMEPQMPRFDEETLTGFTTARNSVGCECPRHLAEILMMVGSFERYSAQCASRNEEDALLHQELGRAAGRARGILEDAMERLA